MTLKSPQITPVQGVSLRSEIVGLDLGEGQVNLVGGQGMAVGVGMGLGLRLRGQVLVRGVGGGRGVGVGKVMGIDWLLSRDRILLRIGLVNFYGEWILGENKKELIIF